MPRQEIYWNPDSSSGVRIEFIGDILQFYYCWKSDDLAQQQQQQQLWHKLCHIPCQDTKNEISRARRDGRRYVYWLSAEYFLVASSINPVSYESVFDLYYYSCAASSCCTADDKCVPRFIFSVPAESKSTHLRLCLVPELCRIEFNNDSSMQVNPLSGEMEYTESRKIQLVVGYDDKLSVYSGLGSRCFQRRVIEIPSSTD